MSRYARVRGPRALGRPRRFGGRRPRVLILVENLPVPFDKRVWQEANTLVAAGYDVTVICPRSAQHPEAYEVLDGVQIHRYRSPFEARRAIGYLLEYPIALLSQLALAAKVHRHGRLDIIQACNPPDLLFLVALPFRWLFGTTFIFDHHDASPELLVAKGKKRGGLLVRMTEAFERWTFRSATVSIATNESYRRIAVERGGMDPDDVFVVRSAPTLSRFAEAREDAELRRGKQHLVAYVGVMGIQEGIDYLLDAADILVNQRGRRDVQFSLAGSGPELPRLVDRVAQLGLADNVTFLGRISDSDLADLLATADVCVNPDEYNEMNDISTMNKVMEYMALGKAIVQFDLTEGRVSAGEASEYARPNDAGSLADCVAELLDDPARRALMGRIGKARFAHELSWEHSEPALLAAYERALTGAGAQAQAPAPILRTGTGTGTGTYTDTNTNRGPEVAAPPEARSRPNHAGKQSIAGLRLRDEGGSPPQQPRAARAVVHLRPNFRPLVRRLMRDLGTNDPASEVDTNDGTHAWARPGTWRPGHAGHGPRAGAVPWRPCATTGRSNPAAAPRARGRSTSACDPQDVRDVQAGRELAESDVVRELLDGME